MPNPEGSLSIAFNLIGAEVVKNKNDKIMASLKSVGDGWRKTNEQIGKARSYIGMLGGMAALQSGIGFGSGEQYKPESFLGSTGQYAGFFATFALADALIANRKEITELIFNKFLSAIETVPIRINFELKRTSKAIMKLWDTANKRMKSGDKALFRTWESIKNTAKRIKSGDKALFRTWESIKNTAKRIKSGEINLKTISTELGLRAASIAQSVANTSQKILKTMASPISSMSGFDVSEMLVGSMKSISTAIMKTPRMLLGGTKAAGRAIGKGLGKAIAGGMKMLGAAVGSLLGPVGTVVGYIVTAIIAEKVGEWLGMAGEWLDKNAIQPVVAFAKETNSAFQDWIAKNITGSTVISRQFDTKRLNQVSLERLNEEIQSMRKELVTGMEEEGWSPEQIRWQLFDLNTEVQKLKKANDWEIKKIYETFEFVSRR